MLWLLGWILTIFGTIFLWWLSGVVLLIVGVYIYSKYDPEGAVDHIVLEDAIEAAGMAFFGPILIGFAVYGICTDLKKNKGKIVVWKSKSYKTKEVLGLKHKGLPK
jgi:hypothetical protein